MNKTIDEPAIIVESLTKEFILPHKKHGSLKSLFVDLGRKGKADKRKVLNDISFTINKGEFFGIVGRNGSGKSTLLKLLAGVYTPTSGHIQVNGSLTPFIELGVGFNPELTGRENVFLNGALLGFTHKQMEEMYKDIVEFAELHDFMDQKLKNYSSGMQVRLAFSIAIRAKSDILLIDEVLAVGDTAFQSKCFEYFRGLKNSSKTVILVSHDRGAIEQYCNKAMLIEAGKIIAIDEPKKVFGIYSDITIDHLEGKKKDCKDSKRWGDQSVTIYNATLSVNEISKKTCKPNDTISIVLKCQANKDVVSPIYGVTMSRKGEPPVFATNTLLSGVKTNDLKTGQRIKITFTTKNIFGNGTYYMSPAVADQDGSIIYDWRDNFLQLNIVGQANPYSIINPEHKITLESTSWPQ